jgi:hypothetical protein
VLARVRVDGAKRRFEDFCSLRERGVRVCDCPLHQALLDFGDSVDQAGIVVTSNAPPAWAAMIGPPANIALTIIRPKDFGDIEQKTKVRTSVNRIRSATPSSTASDFNSLAYR